MRKCIAKIIKICYRFWQIDYNYEETLNFVCYPDWLSTQSGEWKNEWKKFKNSWLSKAYFQIYTFFIPAKNNL